MLNHLDQVIRTVLDTNWTAAPPPAKPVFSFSVPDDAFRARVRTGPDMQLNIYLYELKENRDFRRAPWDAIELSDRTSVLSQPPAYFDCHYMISAWSPAEDTDITQPSVDEHEILGEALRGLLSNPDVTPATLGVPGGGPVFQQAHVYLTVAPPEMPRALNDFWSTMKLPWKPAIQLVVTAPVDLLRDLPPAPLMATFVQRYGLIGAAEFDEFVQIGGWVLTPADVPIAGATVLRVGTTDQTTTDAQGRFSFARLRRGVHRLRATAPGMSTDEHNVNVPAGPPEEHIFKLT